ncbi:PDIL2-1 [Symbiodinium pilosum]|uniref:PDIL2-1 protein n=1 Tax=Symbiodinium pilosum TaxID=2952 RepID=A0A812JXP2_SYMPI|nr:PDIL2-1 [Symbiodinium pilosum]
MAAAAGLTQMALQLIMTLEHLSKENAWSSGLSTPDLVIVLFQTSAAVLMVTVCLGSCLNCELCRSFSEALWACAIGANIIAGVLHSRWWRSWLAERDLDLTETTSEISAILLSVVFVAVACHCLPLRCCFLGPLVVLAAVASSLQATMSGGQMLGAQLLNAALLLFLLISSYCTAHRSEREVRVGWLRGSSQDCRVHEAYAEKEIFKAALARDLKLFKLYGCFLALSLHEDFQIGSGSLEAAKAFFGQDVEGLNFLTLVDKPDRESFLQLCRHIDGSRIPRRVTMKLILEAHPAACQLVLLYHGRPGRTYLLGIRSLRGILTHRRPTSGAKQDPGPQDQQETRHPLAPDHVIPAPGHLNPKPPEQEELQKLDRDDFSGFSSDPDGSSASLCYTSSSGDKDASGFSFLVGTDGAAQTDPTLGKADAWVETDAAWSEDGFRCRCCSLPPCPLDDEQRDALACSNFKPRRRKRKHSSFEVLQGTWALEPSFASIAQKFMHRLTFIGDRCIDALGQRWKITDDGDSLYLIKGRVWVSGGVLFREGKSGIVMRFQREEDAAASFEEDDDLDGDMGEQDSLHVLENIVSQCYDDRSRVQDLLLELLPE